MKNRFDTLKITAYFKHDLTTRIDTHRKDGYVAVNQGCVESGVQCWAILKKIDKEEKDYE